MGAWKKRVILICCLVVVFVLAGFAGRSFQLWREDGYIEIDGELVKRDRRGIKGSHYLDIPTRLEELGFPEHKVEENLQKECMEIPITSYLDEPTGINCIYSIEYTYVGEIMEAKFDVINLDRIDNQTFLETAENYLGFCVMLPYEKEDVEQVHAWLEENIETVARGREAARITVGDATFELLGSDQDGSCGARSLVISRSEK